MTIRACRDVYRGLRERALTAAEDPTKRSYIRTLWATWDHHLGMLDQSAEVSTHVEWLTQVVTERALSSDALVEWLDAYPSAITATD